MLKELAEDRSESTFKDFKGAYTPGQAKLEAHRCPVLFRRSLRAGMPHGDRDSSVHSQNRDRESQGLRADDF